MRLIKKVLLASGLIIIAIQFLQPPHNKSEQLLATDISKIVGIPDTVRSVLIKSCYDCHSNNTIYPWYSNIQPVGWLMAYHIKHAKGELNFSEFGNYSQRRQVSKLDGIANSIKDDLMPLSSYKLMHKNARLSTNGKTMIRNWTEQLIDSLSANN